MKWLLLITLSLYSFIVQSAPCALTNVGEQRGTYILKPLSMKVCRLTRDDQRH